MGEKIIRAHFNYQINKRSKETKKKKTIIIGLTNEESTERT